MVISADQALEGHVSRAGALRGLESDARWEVGSPPSARSSTPSNLRYPDQAWARGGAISMVISADQALEGHVSRTGARRGLERMVHLLGETEVILSSTQPLHQTASSRVCSCL